jgi:hypothetical protein
MNTIECKSKLTNQHSTGTKTAVLLASFALAVATSHAVVLDDFNGPPKWDGENDPSGVVTNIIVDQQLQFTADFKTATNPDNPLNTFGNVYYLTNLPVRSRQTLELRVDLVWANQDNVFAYLGTMNARGGEYLLIRDRDEIGLVKWSQADGFSLPFWQPCPVKSRNVVLVLTLTPVGEALYVGVKVIDKASQWVLFERIVMDDPGRNWLAPDPAPHGWKIFTPDVGSPYADDVTVAWVGIHQVTDGLQGLAELRLDNLEYDIYPSSYLGSERAAWVSWPENTAEEQIVVGTSSLASNAVWTPWPEPIYKRHGELCMAVPTTATKQFVKLVPGTQFIDDFSDPQEPFAVRNPWVPGFYAPADATRWDVSTSNGVLRVQALVPPADPTGRLVIKPPGPYVQVRDFWMSVDILHFDTTRQYAGIGLGARAGGDLDHWPGANNGYIGSVYPNHDAGNQARLTLWNGNSDTSGPPFTFKPGTPYRLIFSGVGSRLTVELIDLELQQPAVAPLVVTDSTFSQGFVAFFMEAGAATCDMTLDNFFATGTKP